MSPYPHQELKHEVLKEIIPLIQGGGLPSGEQIEELRQCILKDEAVSGDEADLLFYIKNTTAHMSTMKLKHQGPKAMPGFRDLFVQAITSYLLFSGGTPGSLDTNEFIWLSDYIKDDHNYDYFERELLINIALKAENLPINFYKLAEKFEEKVESRKRDTNDQDWEEKITFINKIKTILDHKNNSQNINIED